METQEVLGKQESEIKKKLQLVFIPIVIMAFAIYFYQSNSLGFNKDRYLKSRKFSFAGKVIKKKQDGDYPRAERYVLLEDYHKEILTNDIYYKINIGDSVYKKKDSDSVYFCLKSGEILIRDYNKTLREKYLQLVSDE